MPIDRASSQELPVIRVARGAAELPDRGHRDHRRAGEPGIAVVQRAISVRIIGGGEEERQQYDLHVASRDRSNACATTSRGTITPPARRSTT
jgi:hypothetical protein